MATTTLDLETEMIVKKRKRDSGDDTGLKKKQQKAQSQRQKKISFSTTNLQNQWSPAFVSAPGLNYNSRELLSAYGKDADLLLTSTLHPKLDYLAQEEASGGSESFLKHYLGIYDPKIGRVKVVPAVKLILRSRLRKGPTEEDEDNELPSNHRRAREALGEAFGTKQSKKAIRALAENAIMSESNSRTEDGKLILDNVASAVLDTMDAVIGGMPDKDALQQASDASKPRPKMNLSAEAVEDVFSLDDLIGNDIIYLLNTQSWLEDVNAGKPISTTSQFVASHVEQVMKESKSSPMKKDKVLCYYLSLLRWQRCLRKSYREGWKLPKRADLEENLSDINERVLMRINRKFAPNGDLNRWRQEFFYMHLCAMALIIDDYQVDLQELQVDTGLERAQLQKYFDELGCRITRMNDLQRGQRGLTKKDADARRLATMKIPLEFPKLRTQVRR